MITKSLRFIPFICVFFGVISSANAASQAEKDQVVKEALLFIMFSEKANDPEYKKFVAVDNCFFTFGKNNNLSTWFEVDLKQAVWSSTEVAVNKDGTKVFKAQCSGECMNFGGFAKKSEFAITIGANLERSKNALKDIQQSCPGVKGYSKY